MQFSAIVLALAAASQAAAVAIPDKQELAARAEHISCAEVTRKLNACTNACPGSDWRCNVNWYVHCSLSVLTGSLGTRRTFC